jgi:hypothetical protein
LLAEHPIEPLDDGAESILVLLMVVPVERLKHVTDSNGVLAPQTCQQVPFEGSEGAVQLAVQAEALRGDRAVNVCGRNGAEVGQASVEAFP